MKKSDQPKVNCDAELLPAAAASRRGQGVRWDDLSLKTAALQKRLHKLGRIARLEREATGEETW